MCNHKRDGEEVCATPHYSPQTIMEAFVQAFNTVLMDKEQLAEDYEFILEFLCDTEAAEIEEAELNGRCTMLLGKLRELINENASAVQNQEEYQQKYERLSSQFEQTKTRLDELERESQNRRALRIQIKSFLEGLLEQSTPLEAWDEELWYNTGLCDRRGGRLPDLHLPRRKRRTGESITRWTNTRGAGCAGFVGVFVFKIFL